MYSTMDRVYTLLLQQKIDHTACIVSYRGYWYYSNVTETEKKDGDDHATCIVSYRIVAIDTTPT